MTFFESLFLVWAIVATVVAVFFCAGMMEWEKRCREAWTQLEVAAGFINGTKKKMILLGALSVLVLYLVAKKLDDAPPGE